MTERELVTVVVIGYDWHLARWVRPDCVCEDCAQPLGGSWERGAENPAWLKYDAERSTPCLIFNDVRCVDCGPGDDEA